MFWRCIHDPFGYCKTQPDGAAKALENTSEIMQKAGVGATCSLEPKTCGLHQTFNEVMEADLLERAQSPKSSKVKTTIIFDKNAKKDEGRQRGWFDVLPPS